jgi:KDO2-lipid IV(A) lauroyltransferase
MENNRIKFLHRIEYLFFIILATFIRIIPRNLAYFFGRKLGLLWALISRKRFHTAFQNLSFAFPEYTNSQKKRITYACFQNMALSGVDLFRLDLYSKSEFERLFEVEGKNNLEIALKKQTSIVFMTAHLGFWESGAFVFPYFGLAANPITKTIKNPLINDYIIRQRSFMGNEVIDKKNAVRKMLKTIQEKKALGILIDQHIHKEEAVYVPFFGRNAYTSPVIINLAVKKGLPFVPIFCYREAKNRFKIIIHEPIFFEDDHNGGATNTALVNQIIENAIRKNPEQWMWIHRRWR